MGYQINSSWTKLRKNDIMKLNEIIDDEYCIEQEIGRKLHIKEVFDKLLIKEISNFKFDVVIKFMMDNNWTWVMYGNNGSYEAVPTYSDIIKVIKTDLYKHCLYDIIELNKRTTGVSTGGLVLDMGMTGDYASENTCYLNIYFDIAHFVKD